MMLLQSVNLQGLKYKTLELNDFEQNDETFMYILHIPIFSIIILNFIFKLCTQNAWALHLKSPLSEFKNEHYS